MYPDIVFLGLDLYGWLVVAGIVAALVVFRVYADKKEIPAKLQNFCLLFLVISIAIGFGFAILFQAVYDFTKTGVFALDRNTGMTFYGGLVGGTAAFVAFYFTAVKKLCGEGTAERFGEIAGIAACAVALGHSIGRIGCLMAGCCYGAETDSWVGVWHPNLGKKVIPTQLFESIFLFLLFIGLSVLLFKTKVGVFPVYLSLYGVWRFTIEFWRADDRGASFIPALSPSQLWSVVLFALGAALLAWQFIRWRKRRGTP